MALKYLCDPEKSNIGENYSFKSMHYERRKSGNKFNGHKYLPQLLKKKKTKQIQRIKGNTSNKTRN